MGETKESMKRDKESGGEGENKRKSLGRMVGWLV